MVLNPTNCFSEVICECSNFIPNSISRGNRMELIKGVCLHYLCRETHITELSRFSFTKHKRMSLCVLTATASCTRLWGKYILSFLSIFELKSHKTQVLPISVGMTSFLGFTIVKHFIRSVKKYLTFGREKKIAYLEHWKPNHPQSSLLGTPHTSPSGAAIVGSIPRKPLSKWSLARLSLQP